MRLLRRSEDSGGSHRVPKLSTRAPVVDRDMDLVFHTAPGGLPVYRVSPSSVADPERPMPETKPLPYHIHILRSELERRRRKNPRYSLRAFSARLGVDPSGLSRI